MEITPPAVPEQPTTPEPVATPEVIGAPSAVEMPDPAVEAAIKADDDEWDAAQSDVFGDLSGKEEDPDKQTEKPVNTPVEPAPPASPVEEPKAPASPVEAPKAAEYARPTTPTPEELDVIAQRVMSRNSQVAIESAKSEIKARIMPDIPELKANDGFVVKSAKDLETIEDPRTPGVAFTPQEAERVYNEHLKSVREIESQADARAAHIATVNQGLMDEATLALAAFKDVFEANPDLQKSLFEAYSKTLKISQDGFIEEAPVGLLEFYNATLSPYVKAQRSAVATPPAAPQPVDNTNRHQDRSDIYKPTTSVLSKEEEEWKEAEREVLGVK